MVRHELLAKIGQALIRDSADPAPPRLAGGASS
jgi:hypothetical protein